MGLGLEALAFHFANILHLAQIIKPCPSTRGIVESLLCFRLPWPYSGTALGPAQSSAVLPSC